MSSWYIENGCLKIEELQPVWFLVLSNVLQALVTAIILVKDDDDDDGCCPKPIVDCFKGCAHCLQPVLRILSVIQIVIVFILDLITMIQWITNHSDLDGWDHFLCMGAVLFSSSNFKTSLIIFVGILLQQDIEILFGGRAEESGTYMLLITVVFIYWMAISSWVIVIECVSIFVVGWWLIISINIVMFIIAYCAYNVCDHVCSGYDRERILFVVLMVECTAYAMLAGPCCLGMINVYGGQNYWIGAYQPFRERHWSLYWSYVQEKVQGVIKFMFWVL